MTHRYKFPSQSGSSKNVFVNKAPVAVKIHVFKIELVAVNCTWQDQANPPAQEHVRGQIGRIAVKPTMVARFGWQQ